MENSRTPAPEGVPVREPAVPTGPTVQPDRPRRVWSVDEAAAILGISRAHAYELVARNELAHVRLGRRIVIPIDVVDRLLDVAGTYFSAPSSTAPSASAN